MKDSLRVLGIICLAALVLGVAGAAARRSATTTTIRVQVIGVGTVGDSQNGILCGNGPTRCRATYPGSGTDIDFTATPDTGSGWAFENWSGDCSGTDPAVCAVTLDLADADHEVIAVFTKVGATKSMLTVAAQGESAGDDGNVSGGDIDCDVGTSAGCTWDLTTGSTVALVEKPDDGSIFGGWGGACSGTSATCTLGVSAELSVTATFRKPKVTVTVSGAGTVSGSGIACTSASGTNCSAAITAGQQITLTATPDAGGAFTGWTGGCTGTDATCTLTVTADTSLGATFSGGGGGGGGGGTFPLSVSVSGDGRVAGAGITCGAGASQCSADETAGSNVVLTATPSAGATFSGWGGACSGRSSTCSLTMSATRSVTASFSGGSTAEVALTVAVSGRGKVIGGGIDCGNGGKACSVKEKQGSSVGLTAAPAASASFAGWGGACSGTKRTCTVEMDAASSVTARFTGGSGRAPSGTATLRRVGSPIVSRAAAGFKVTLRFRNGQRGRARMLALRAGRVETALAFTAPAGTATIGPFPLAKAGFYTFELRLGGRTLRWTACLGRCGEHATASPFVLIRGRPTVDDAGALWSVTLHFRTTEPSGISARAYRGKRLARQISFAARAGREDVAFLLSPGTYTFKLTAIDAYGRRRNLTWLAVLS